MLIKFAYIPLVIFPSDLAKRATFNAFESFHSQERILQKRMVSKDPGFLSPPDLISTIYVVLNIESQAGISQII